MKINPNLETYFYDDRGKHDFMLKITQILYEDSETCLCLAESVTPGEQIKEKILFSLDNRKVLNEDYSSWLATNDMDWAKTEELRLKTRR